ncbi:MAG TPA: iron-containing redox enzyme family protein [Candidatus Binatia bacterium]|jgi:pyrroloquinoline quinone (PQQ) biosynthesis protein C
MNQAIDSGELSKTIRRMANDHHSTPEVQYLFETRFTPERAKVWTINQAHFVRNRRDCWALAMGQAPLDVKREIWLHEQDELIGDARAGGEDHFTLTTKEAALLGVSAEEMARSEPHPFVAAALEAWLHLGKQSWLESFCAVSMVEAINSNAIIATGGFSSRSRDRLVTDLGLAKESLTNRNVHVEADQEHALVLDKVLSRHVKTERERDTVMAALRKTLIIDRAYRAGLAFAMNQLPL